MYVMTFYSFKGGVGRTMALLNVAGELLRKGRSVLVVDFDLEAPGIDTYKLPRPSTRTPGIVEYVTEYLQTGVAPSFLGFCYESPRVVEGSGRLWIMPSGRQEQPEYAAELAAIDWQDLYANRDGFLLFQNLRAEWENRLQPDYVLIDSRTGHTDVTGICTRQLPDAVAVFFHPDEQNRRGLASIVHQIRDEATSPRHRDIKLYFVMSNVPDLDDEDEILARSMEQSRESLGYRELTAVIHRYNSLALLNQVIFTIERPKSRLAAEYRALVEAFVKDNLGDREAALALLASISRPGRLLREVKASDLEQKLSRIRTAHSKDGEVMLRLAQIRRRQGKRAEALALLDEAERLAAPLVEVYLTRAELLQQAGDSQGAADNAAKVLDFSSVDYLALSETVGILRKTSWLNKIASSAAIRGLDPDDRFELATELHTNRDELLISERILNDALDDPRTPPHTSENIRAELRMVLVGLRAFQRAIQMEEEARMSPENRERDAFNLAMAHWGADGTPSTESFQRFLVLAVSRQERPRQNANYAQCLALAKAVVGLTSEAFADIDAARKLAHSGSEPIFSAWVYLEVPPEEFARHVDEQEMMTRSGIVRPPIVYSGEQTLFPV